MSQKTVVTNPVESFYEINVTAGGALEPVVVKPGESVKFDLPLSIVQGNHVVISAG